MTDWLNYGYNIYRKRQTHNLSASLLPCSLITTSPHHHITLCLQIHHFFSYYCNSYCNMWLHPRIVPTFCAMWRVVRRRRIFFQANWLCWFSFPCWSPFLLIWTCFHHVYRRDEWLNLHEEENADADEDCLFWRARKGSQDYYWGDHEWQSLVLLSRWKMRGEEGWMFSCYTNFELAKIGFTEGRNWEAFVASDGSKTMLASVWHHDKCTDIT